MCKMYIHIRTTTGNHDAVPASIVVALTLSSIVSDSGRYACIYIYVCVCVFVCVYTVFIYIYIYIINNKEEYFSEPCIQLYL